MIFSKVLFTTLITHLVSNCIVKTPKTSNDIDATWIKHKNRLYFIHTGEFMGKSRSVVQRFTVLPTKAIKRFKKFHRNTKLALSLTAILLIVGIAVTLTQKDSVINSPVAQSTVEEEGLEDAPSISATLTTVEGIVEYRDELGSWQKALKDTALKPNMGLRTTGASSRAAVTFEEGSIVRLDANSEITFERVSATRITINQESGYIYSRVSESSSRLYQVVTENAQFEALGTAFRTTASGDEEAVEVFENSVRETVNNKSAKEGQKLIAKSNINLEASGTTEQLDIEKIKEDAFIVWNRDQDKSVSAYKNKLGFLADFDGPKIENIDPATGTTIDVSEESTVGSVTIKGKTEKGTKLTIQSKSTSGSSPVEVTVQDDGSFDSGLMTGPIGTAVFELIAKDKIGNTTKQNVSYSFKKPIAIQQEDILLSVDSSNDEMVTLNWSLVGISTPDGVKVLVSEGTKTSLTLSNEHDSVDTGMTTWSEDVPSSTFKKGKTYSIAVCRYLSSSDSCDVFSDIVSYKVPN